MKTFALLIPLVLLAGPARAQTFASASQVFEKARHAELITGDLDRAASLYEQVAESVSASRADVAKALIAVGELYELTAPASAREAYERVVAEFSDIPNAFHQAQDGLGRLGVDAPVTSQDYTLLMDDMPQTPGNRRKFDISPDGTKLVVRARASDGRKASFPQLRAELYLVDVGGNLRRPLLENPGNWVSMHGPQWSPDSRRVAFVVHGEGGRSIAITDVSSGDTHLLDGEELRSVRPPIWTADSDHVILVRENVLRIVDLEGTLRREIPWDEQRMHMLAFGDVSPDGRLLLYHRMSEESDLHQEVDIWTIDLETGERKQQTHESGYEGWATWNEDGSAYFYSAGSEQVRNIYRRELGPGTTPEQITSYNNTVATTPVFVRATGGLGFALANTSHTVVVAEGQTGLNPDPVLRGKTPEVSPDGTTIYYLSNEPGRTGLWAADIDGSNPRQLASGRIASSYAVHEFLSPDGAQIAFFRHEGSETVLHVMASEGGESRILYRARGLQSLTPTWSPDGTELAFSDEGDLKVVSVEGGPVETLATVTRWEGWTPSWAPEGSLIAGLGFVDGEKENSILIVDRHSGEMRRLTPPALDAYKEIIDWHPRGEKISFMYYGAEFEDQYYDGSLVVSLDDAESELLVDMADGFWDYIGVWGPDEAYYFSTTKPGHNYGWMLYRYVPGQGEPTLVREVANIEVGLPSWSRDGSVVAWDETRKKNQLWMLSDL